MAATKPRTSSFSRNATAASPAAPSSQTPGLKAGPNGTTFVSSGIPDLDKILGGGFALGSLVMVMEDPESPHHMLLLRNFMSQSILHSQPLLYASPSKDPKAFLGTLPSPVSSRPDNFKPRKPDSDSNQDKDLRIAWQYRKYDESQQILGTHRDSRLEFCNDFDLRKPLERQFLVGKQIDCVSTWDSPNLVSLRSRCAAFLSQFSRNDSTVSLAGRIAIQSLCAPQCAYSDTEWDVLSFLRSLKGMVRTSNAVAVVTFPSTLLSLSASKRCQHMADTLLSVKTIPDEDKELAKLLTGYQDMVGLINVHKVARINTQVPMILEATTFSIKLQKRRFLVLECLNQAPIDGSSGSSYGTSASCSGSSNSTTLDF